MALGDDLHNLASSILKLMQTTKSVDQKKKLRDGLDAVLDKTDLLVGQNLDTATAEYAAVTKGLSDANTAITAALADLAKVAATIQTIAKVIDALGKLAAKAGLI